MQGGAHGLNPKLDAQGIARGSVGSLISAGGRFGKSGERAAAGCTASSNVGRDGSSWRLLGLSMTAMDLENMDMKRKHELEGVTQSGSGI